MPSNSASLLQLTLLLPQPPASNRIASHSRRPLVPPPLRYLSAHHLPPTLTPPPPPSSSLCLESSYLKRFPSPYLVRRPSTPLVKEVMYAPKIMYPSYSKNQTRYIVEKGFDLEIAFVPFLSLPFTVSYPFTHPSFFFRLFLISIDLHQRAWVREVTRMFFLLIYVPFQGSVWRKRKR